MKRVVFLNGRFLSEDEAAVSACSQGLLCGLGVFETMRWLKGKVIYLDAHLRRIKDSCFLLGINFAYPLPELKRIIRETAALNKLRDAYLRLTISKAALGSDTSVLARQYTGYPFSKYKEGFSLQVCRFRQNEDSFFCRIKTTSRAFYELAYQQARQEGFDEALLLNRRGYICEGSRSNIFLVNKNELLTPSLECGCLPGITRRAVLELAARYGIKSYQMRLTLSDLEGAEGAFLTNSLLGIMPLRNKGSQLCDFLRKRYNSLLR